MEVALTVVLTIAGFGFLARTFFQGFKLGGRTTWFDALVTAVVYALPYFTSALMFLLATGWRP